MKGKDLTVVLMWGLKRRRDVASGEPMLELRLNRGVCSSSPPSSEKTQELLIPSQAPRRDFDLFTDDDLILKMAL